jgi:hypothetical protein
MAHMLGFGGHFLTKSQRHRVTFRLLREARAAGQRTVNTTGPEADGQPSEQETVWSSTSSNSSAPAGTPPATPCSPPRPPTSPAAGQTPIPRSIRRSVFEESTVDKTIRAGTEERTMHRKRTEHDMTDNDIRVGGTTDHEHRGTGQVLTVEDLAVPRALWQLHLGRSQGCITDDCP